MIAITGLGIISAIGNDAAETLDALRNGRSGVGKMTYLPSSHTELPVGEVKLSNAELKQLLGIADSEHTSRTALLGAVAAKQALVSAGLATASADGKLSLRPEAQGKRVAFVNGTTVGGMDITEAVFKGIREGNAPAELIAHHDCGSSTDDVLAILGLDCEATTISTACSSALNAIARGADMLKAGEADIVIAGGTEALSVFHLNGFNTLLILDHEQCRPFDQSRAGINLGEGAAYLILQRDEDLQPSSLNGTAEGTPLAYVGGYGNACDAFHQTASSEDGEGAYLAMTEALRSAGLQPSDIQYVNAHGTGTPNNDASESAALRRVFGDAMPPVSSTKAFTGHTTSASGSIEAVMCILAMQHGFIPPSLGWKEADPTCITPYAGGSQNDNAASLTNVVCNAFGFGGNDSSLVLCKEKPANAEPYSPLDCEIEQVAEVIIDDPEQLKDSKDVIKPMEARRMGALLKAATLTSVKALRQAGIECPDAIITATRYGMLDTSEKFLLDLCENGEDLLKPTLFMQSTHNTVSSSIAIRTKCHGYNITYSQGDRSLECALSNARYLLRTGKAKTVLVGLHDESTEIFRTLMQQLGQPAPKEIYSRSIVLKNAN